MVIFFFHLAKAIMFQAYKNWNKNSTRDDQITITLNTYSYEKKHNQQNSILYLKSGIFWFYSQDCPPSKKKMTLS